MNKCVYKRERDRPFLFVEASAGAISAASAAVGGLVGTSGRSNFSSWDGNDAGTLGISWTEIWKYESELRWVKGYYMSHC